MKPRLLDLFCGAGLAAEGYIAAGWEVVGVDITPQPDYSSQFVQADALAHLTSLVIHEETPGLRNFVGMDVGAIHASPPCQFLTSARHLRRAQGGESKYPDLLTPTLELIRKTGLPWVVENVEGARAYMQPQEHEYLVRVCGSSFGLEVQRHRLFLSNVPIIGTECRHDTFPIDPDSGKPRPWGVYHVPGDSIPKGGRTALNAAHAAALFGLTRWLPWDFIKEGFPPAYTEWVGRQLMRAITRDEAA